MKIEYGFRFDVDPPGIALFIEMDDGWTVVVPEFSQSELPGILRACAAATDRHLAKTPEEKAAAYKAAFADIHGHEPTELHAGHPDRFVGPS